MKNVSILHGWGGTPKHFWFPWLAEQLTQKGYNVWCPSLPDTDNPQLAPQLDFVLKNGKFDFHSTLIGHSAACPLILSVLEKISSPVSQVILVAGFYEKVPKAAVQMLQPNYDFKKIASNASDFIFINSDNDPWHCDDKQGRLIQSKLGGTLVVPHGEGHFGSESFKQPYKTFPLLLKLIN